MTQRDLFLRKENHLMKIVKMMSNLLSKKIKNKKRESPQREMIKVNPMIKEKEGKFNFCRNEF